MKNHGLTLILSLLAASSLCAQSSDRIACDLRGEDSLGLCAARSPHDACFGESSCCCELGLCSSRSDQNIPKFFPLFDAGYTTGGGLETTRLSLTGYAPLSMSHSPFACPQEKPDNVFALMTGVKTLFLDGVTALDVPGTLYDISLGGVWTRRINERWSVEAIATANWQSDLKTSDDALGGRAIGRVKWRCREDLTLSLGAAYLNRDDFPILPAVGLEWRPNDCWEVLIGLPKTKVARRVDWFQDHPNTWLYIAPSIGGGRFAARRADGSSDEITIRQFPIAVGLERRGSAVGTLFAEVGYVVEREIEYERGGEQLEFGDGVSFRFGTSY